MLKFQKEELRDDIYSALEKVLTKHVENGKLGFRTPRSLTEMVTDAAMLSISVLEEYYNDLLEGGDII